MSAKVTKRILTVNTLPSSPIGSKTGNSVLDTIRNFDVSHPLLECFQALAAREWRLEYEYPYKDGRRRDILEVRAERSAPSVEALFSKLSDLGVLLILDAMLLQSNQREAIQAAAREKHRDITQDAFKSGDVSATYISLKDHVEKKTSKRIELTQESEKLLDAVSPSVLARYEYTREALVTRSRTKRTTRSGGVFIGKAEV